MYGFKKQFVAPIQAGTKLHTIRANRKYPDKPGNTMHLYYAPRTKHCFLIARVICRLVRPITIEDSGRRWHQVMPVIGDQRVYGIYPRITIEGEVLADDEMESLARCDGFPNLREMSGFWDLNQPFTGQIIHWRPNASS